MKLNFIELMKLPQSLGKFGPNQFLWIEALISVWKQWPKINSNIKKMKKNNDNYIDNDDDVEYDCDDDYYYNYGDDGDKDDDNSDDEEEDGSGRGCNNDD